MADPSADRSAATPAGASPGRGGPAGAVAEVRRRLRSPSQLIALTFLAAIAVGTLLLLLPLSQAPGTQLSLIDALFTATSAVCVTGLMVLDLGSSLTLFGQVVVIVLAQLGGVGVMTFGALAALAVGRRLGLRQRVTLQRQVGTVEFGEVVPLLRAVVVVVLAMELLGALLLWAPLAAQPGPQGVVPAGAVAGGLLALFHSVSAFNNAGLSLYPDSLTRFAHDPLVNLTVGALAVAGSLGFVVIANLWRRSRKGRAERLTLHTRLVLVSTLVLSVVATLGVLALEWSNPATLGELPARVKPLAALFQGISARTVGFETVDVAGLRPATVFFLLPLMFIGGSPGSTAGGIKTVTFVVFVGSAWSMIRGRGDLTLFGRRISSDTAVQAGAIALLGIVLVGAAALTLLILQPQLGVEATLFEAISAFATIGLSTGVTTELGTLGRVTLVLLMYLGRLGPLTLGLALMQRSTVQVIHHPREEVLIG